MTSLDKMRLDDLKAKHFKFDSVNRIHSKKAYPTDNELHPGPAF